RRQERTRTQIALGPVVREALQLLRAAIPASISIQAEVDADVPEVFADATQIHQVVMNLAANAAAAMASKPGRLKVGLGAARVDGALAARHPALSAGPYVRLQVQDEGVGMTPEVVERIFDPFFTTKEAGEGTGLGLSVVHGIVTAHDGAILVDSCPDTGTTFDLYFPAVTGGASA